MGESLAKPPSCVTALYTKNAANINARCSLHIRKAQNINIPLSIAPNVWILASAPSTVTTRINLISPGETIQKPIHILWLPPACCATSPNIHLPPWNEPLALVVSISLDMANLNMVNMSSLVFHIWKQLQDHWNETQLHHLSGIPSVLITQLYKHMVSGNEPIAFFTSPTESIDDTASIWTLFFSHEFTQLL